METLAVGFIIIVAIGAIVLGIAGIAVLIAGWWFIIPIIGACVGGWIGFLFGIGLVVIIGAIIGAIKS